MKYLSDILKFKNPYEKEHLFYLHPAVALIAMDMSFYFACHGHEFVITSSIRSMSENKAVGARSTTHTYEDGARAIDVRTSTVPEEFLRETIKVFSEKYKTVAAVVKSGDKYIPRLILYGDRAHLDHMHIQVKRGIPSHYPLP